MKIRNEKKEFYLQHTADELALTSQVISVNSAASRTLFFLHPAARPNDMGAHPRPLQVHTEATAALSCFKLGPSPPILTSKKLAVVTKNYVSAPETGARLTFIHAN